MSLIFSCLPKPLADRLRVMAKTMQTRPEVIAEAAIESLLDHWEGTDAGIE